MIFFRLTEIFNIHRRFQILVAPFTIWINRGERRGLVFRTPTHWRILSSSMPIDSIPHRSAHMMPAESALVHESP